MTTLLTACTATATRTATPRRYLMCRPDYFEVSYAINPWMDTTVPVDVRLAVAQWTGLKRTFEDIGHIVELIDPVPGLPDMVYAANGALVIGNLGLGASFTHPERQPEGALYFERLRSLGLDAVAEPTATNEGEGDFLVVGDLILAGTGFRTDPRAHDEVQEVFGRPVVTLQLIDSRYYHLDTALAVLDDDNVAYFPGAFSDGSRRVLERLFPDAVIASAADAEVLGLNAVSDGKHVVLTHAALDLHEQLRSHGYDPIGVDLSELLKGGGSVKCCTLELRN